MIKQIRNINENSYYWRRKPSYLPNKMRNSNEIFKKDVTYDYIKIYKKPVHFPFSEKHSFWKATREFLILKEIHFRVKREIFQNVARLL